MGAPRGGCRISGPGDDGGAKAPSEARRCEAPERREGWGLKRDAVALSRMGFGGIAPGKF